MSDTMLGPGWWQASDGKWYRPDQHPGYQPPQPSPTTSAGTAESGPTTMKKRVEFKMANYDGGLTFHSTPEARGKLVLVPGGKWELHYGGRLVLRDRWMHGSIQRYPFEVTATGTTSCHVTMRDKLNTALMASFDLPNTSSSTLERTLHAQQGSLLVSGPVAGKPTAPSATSPVAKPASRKARNASTEKDPGTNKRRKRVIWLLVTIVFVIAIVVATSGGSGTTYSASFQSGGLSVQNPAEVEVYITVKNTGKSSGTPTCTINLSSPGGAYFGVDVITPNNPIRAGGQESYTDTITVTNQGAQYVTIGASSVSC